jgi:hypothetical protein
MIHNSHRSDLLLSELYWRNFSELCGVVSALRRNGSQAVAATNVAAIHKQNQIFTPIVGAISLLAKGRLSFHCRWCWRMWCSLTSRLRNGHSWRR